MLLVHAVQVRPQAVQVGERALGALFDARRGGQGIEQALALVGVDLAFAQQVEHALAFFVHRLLPTCDGAH